MAFEIIAHTADIRLSLTADSFADLFGEGVKGLMEIVGGRSKGERVTREINVSASDRTNLLVDFLNEVLTLAHVNQEAYVGITNLRVEEKEAAGTLRGHRVERFENDVKAVTYHEAEVKNENGKWSVSLVLDV